MNENTSPAPNPVEKKPQQGDAPDDPTGLLSDHDTAAMEGKPIASLPSERREPNIQRLHNSLQRELSDPTDGFEPIPFWMVLIFAGLLFWGGMYISKFSGDYRGEVLDSPHPNGNAIVQEKGEKPPETYDDYVKMGQRVYSQCAACHQADGNGNPGGGIPPLNQSEWVVGNKQSPARLARILLYGLNGNIEVKGRVWNGQMPAWGSQLKDYQIASVLTFVRSNWDNKSAWAKPEDALITTAMVEATRKVEGARATGGGASMTKDQLERVTQKTDLDAAK